MTCCPLARYDTYIQSSTSKSLDWMKRENLQEPPILNGKKPWFPVSIFPTEPIQWERSIKFLPSWRQMPWTRWLQDPSLTWQMKFGIAWRNPYWMIFISLSYPISMLWAQSTLPFILHFCSKHPMIFHDFPNLGHRTRRLQTGSPPSPPEPWNLWPQNSSYPCS